jgi:hypothetical protein
VSLVSEYAHFGDSCLFGAVAGDGPEPGRSSGRHGVVLPRRAALGVGIAGGSHGSCDSRELFGVPASAHSQAGARHEPHLPSLLREGSEEAPALRSPTCSPLGSSATNVAPAPAAGWATPAGF